MTEAREIIERDAIRRDFRARMQPVIRKLARQTVKALRDGIPAQVIYQGFEDALGTMRTGRTAELLSAELVDEIIPDLRVDFADELRRLGL